MEILVREVPPMNVARLKHQGAMDDLGKTWKVFAQRAGEQGLRGSETNLLAIFKTDPKSPRALREYSPATTKRPDQTVAEPLEDYTIPSGKYATWIYQGPYSGLKEAWSRFLNDLKDAGHKLGSKQADWFEVYLDDPQSPPESGQPRTELNAPIR